MKQIKPLYSKEEFAQKGDRIYENQIRSLVEKEYIGHIVAIDIETGNYEIAEDTMTATRQLRQRIPDSQTWVIKIGERTVHKFGGRSLKQKS